MSRCWRVRREERGEQHMINVAVFGANGGIGNAVVKAYLAREDVAAVYAFSRTEVAIDDERLHYIYVDVLNDVSLQIAIESLDEVKLDRMFIALGTLHDEQRMPEKQLTDIQLTNLESVFAINTFAPALIVKALKPVINKSAANTIGILSARVGSISDNRLGGWYAYRASKAALNMFIKTVSIEFARSHKRTTIVGLHPGTVDTQLSKPFQGRLKEGQLFTPEYSADKLVAVMEQATPEQSGLCLAYDGSAIPA